jgi:hypothetical protein
MEFDDYNRIFNGAVVFSPAWKKIPASDGRLKAMAKLALRDEIFPHEVHKTYLTLSEQERQRFDKFKNEIMNRKGE